MLKKISLFTFLCISFFGFAQKNISFLGNLQYNQRMNDIWGYADVSGNEYALVGGTTKTSIVNVTVPNTPIELFSIEGDTSVWRDIKTFNEFAYVTNEEGGGLLIIDLSDLPNSIDYQFWDVDTLNFETAHNIYIDENGIAYLFGSNIKNQGALMLDLNFSNRYEPPLVGIYDDRYVHDGFVRDDVLWSAEVFEGDFSVVDVSDKQNPIVMARQRTSTGFTHQVWLSDDNNYLITNDEKSEAFIDIYDVSDLNNIRRLDKYRTSPDDGIIPHNTFFKGNDFFFTSYYREGVTLVDATKKDNIVEIGKYDTSPFPSGDGFEGCWGVYPYLPSGNILASDREEGLFILSPTYKRACYLEGTIIDTLNNVPKNDMRVEIMGTDYVKESNFDGTYKIGVADSGFYDLRISSPLCQTIIVSGIELLEAQVYNLDIETNCRLATNINEYSNEPKYTFSPNPFKENLQIEFHAEEKLKKIAIYNIQGQLMKELIVDEYSGLINFINNWNSGLYIANFIYNDISYQEILVKSN